MISIRNLLIISGRYPHEHDPISGSFVFSQVEVLKEHFDRIVVISTNPYTPAFLACFLEPGRRLDSLSKDYSYDNVEVRFTHEIVLPVKLLKRFRGNQTLRITRNILSKLRFKPDIVHAHFSWPPGFVGVRIAEEYGIPCIITIHEDHDWLIREENDPKIRETWKRAHTLIRVNNVDVPLLEKYNVSVRTIPNGFQPLKFHPLELESCRKLLDLPGDRFVTFCLGSLIERKGFQDLLEAARSIVKKDEKILFVIGGDGPLKMRLLKLIEKYGLTDHVKLTGYIADDQVPIWMNAANIFVLPSYSEGNPTVMFEALGCGKPYIGTDVGGVPEIITDHRLGSLVEPGDVAGLAKSICSSIVTEWDDAFILDHAQQFTWEKVGSQLMNIYSQLTEDVIGT